MALDMSTKLDLAFNTSSQIEMEVAFSKHQLVSRIRREFIDSGAEAQLIKEEINVDFGLDLLAQMSIHKRAPLEALIGLLKKHFSETNNPVQACADALLDAAKKDLVDIDQTVIQIDAETGKHRPIMMFVIRYDISADVQQDIDLYQYPLPMIQEPELLTNNMQTGYVTIRNSVILRNNHTEDDVCLDHLNRVNQTPLALNADTVAFVNNRWKNLDKAKEGEPYEDFLKRKKAFQKYDRTSRDVIAALMAQSDRFWLTHKYDKRGRVYCQGYHVHYQGNDWNKAVVEFADQEVLNLT